MPHAMIFVRVVQVFAGGLRRTAMHDGRKHRPPNQNHLIAIKMADAILMAMSIYVTLDPEEGALNGNPATICP